jgi:UDP-glucose 4-epimerase
VKDCAAGIQLVHMSSRLRHTTYNIGAGRAFSYRQVAEAINAAMPSASMELPAGGGARTQPFMDIARAREDAGYEPEYDITRGMADYLEWLRCNPQ